MVIGTGVSAKRIIENFEEVFITNTFIGCVSTYKKSVVPGKVILGNVSQLSQLIEKYNIVEVIIALDDNAEEKELFEIVNKLYRYEVDIKFAPRLFDVLMGRANISRLDIEPVVSITTPNMSDWESSMKRFFDIIFSVVSLILLLPLIIYSAIRIKRDSSGPVFYKQERIGRFGKPFHIIKFRTMYVGAESSVPKLSSATDDRITPFGRILRKYRVDEIPQFWNIIRGDMSLVGPRPERRFYINQIIEDAPYYCLLYKIRPGLTSWGPIKIGYTDTLEKMVERLNYDIIYLENMSLLNDLKILL